MADFLAMQDIDAFLINPTVRMSEEGDSQSASLPGDVVPIFVAGGSKTAKSERTAAFSNKDAVRDFTDKFILPRGYTSEEEVPSPTDYDDSGFQFTSSDTESSGSFEDDSLVDEHPFEAQAVQLCAKAQAVQFVSAGRPKVINVPRSADVSSAESSPTFSDGGQAVIFGSSKSHQRARLASDVRRRPLPSSNSYSRPLGEPRNIKRTPVLSRLDAAPTSTPVLSKQSQTPLAAQRAEFSRQNPFPEDWPLPSPTSPTSPRRRVPKLSTTLHFRNFSTPHRNSSCSSTSSTASADYDYRLAPRSAPIGAESDYTPRTINQSPRPKMVPRGANERAPPIVLPPCPADYNDAWWSGDDMSLPSPPRESANYVKNLRRKSLSAALATVQV